ncbi:MAG TPA: VWA domain-containing protein [Candidatus Binataceae bacterium]|nr:VWA domain-containing protein [Candidatus Binataceae bacterium]
MAINKHRSAKTARMTAIAVVLFAVALVFPHARRALAEGGSSPPPLIIPSNQNPAGSTLELPPLPSRQGTTASIPPPGPQPGQELVIPTRELREQPGYEQVTVTVTDHNGTYVTNLQKDDFRLSMDGQQRPIEFFRQDLNTPVSIGIVVDTSGSMQPKIPQARRAIAQFLSNLNDRDDVFLFAFSTRPFLLQDFTMDHDLVMRRLSLLRAYGNTALFDVIVRALQKVQEGRWDKKALLVVTDGMDNSSGSTLNDVASQARRMGVLVYSIGIGDPNAIDGPSLAIGPFVIGGSGIERVDAQTLRMLSTETGAKTYIIRQVGDGEMLRKACEQISLELREQYTIGFLAPDPKSGGYRSLGVEVPTHPGVDVRVRKGIDVGSSRAYAAEPPSESAR